MDTETAQVTQQPQQAQVPQNTPTGPSSWADVSKQSVSENQTPVVSDKPVSTEQPKVPDWAKDLPEEIYKWSTNKGFSDPSKDLQKIMTSAYHAEKMVGLERAGRLTEIPNEKSTPDQVKSFYSKLGVPENHEGYKFDEKVESFDPHFASVVAKAMHENNIPVKAAKGLESAFNNYMKEAVASQTKEHEISKQAQIQELFNEWGETKDARISMVNSVSKKLGVDNGTLVDSLASKLGYKKAYDIINNVNMMVNNKESPFVSSGSQANNTENLNGMSPATAKEELQRLTYDPAFQSRIKRNDISALNHISTLGRIASKS